MQALPPQYFEAEYEPVLAELRAMPPNFREAELDAVVEERATVLEVVTERLSKHVLANYDMFLQGVNEAASVEEDLHVCLLKLLSAKAC